MNDTRVQMQMTLNGCSQTLHVRLHESLLDVLRRQGCASVKRVCESADCGACSVLVDAKLIDACTTLALQVDGKRIETAEALSTRHMLHPLQQAFLTHAAVQCGFCIPGMVLSLKHLLDTRPHASEAEIREVMTLCRCTGYQKPLEAVLEYQRTLLGAKEKS